MAARTDPISGKWGHDGVVFLDLHCDDSGKVSGLVMSGAPTNMVPIGGGRFDRATGALKLLGTAKLLSDGVVTDYLIEGALKERTLTVRAIFGEYDAVHELSKSGAKRRWWPRSQLRAQLMPRVFRVFRFVFGLSRPSRATNERRMRERGESLASFTVRDAIPEDIPALARLHVAAWNATYNPMGIRGPTVEVREFQWREWFARIGERWFLLVIEAPDHRLVGFVHGRLRDDAAGDLNKIYLLPEYYRLGLGRRMLGHAARRFIDLDVRCMTLGCDPRNPSCAFYERLGGVLKPDHRGIMDYATYHWDNLPALAERCRDPSASS